MLDGIWTILWVIPHQGCSMETDDQVFARVKGALATSGVAMHEQYQDFLCDNGTFEAYWQDGWDAIVSNTVEQFVFGRDVMIAVGRIHSTPNELIQTLAFELDRAATNHAKGLKI